MIRVFFLIFSLLLTMENHAAWDPQMLFDDSFQVKDWSQQLADPKFQSLKGKVIVELAGSWCSSEKAEMIMDFILLTKPKNSAEIGVFTGSSILPIAATLKFLNSGKITAIDPWSNDIAVKNMSRTDPNREWWSKVDMKAVEKTFHSMLKKWNLSFVCSVIKSDSETAVSGISTLDFLHMDGNYDTALNDAKLYLPKVKVGGYVLLSNLFLMVNDVQRKEEAFNYLLDYCEIICEVESNNCVLLKKVNETVK